MVSKTQFSIVTGSPPAYLSRNRCAIERVSNYRYPILLFPMVFTFLLLMEITTDFFAQKKFAKDLFLTRNLSLIRLIRNRTSCRTIQGEIVLVISDRPCASRSSDFQISRPITRLRADYSLN